jgi:CheY-like chemotaxis protein
MDISDRQYQELLESFSRIRHSGIDPDRPADRVAPGQALWTARQIEARQAGHQEADRPKASTRVAGNLKEVLLVDPEVDRLHAAQNALRFVADVVACSEFTAARAQLLSRPPDLLVTNLRLHAYNGLHLVHMAKGTLTRCIVFDASEDRGLAQEVQAAGAFYEHSQRVPRALASYVHAVLPPYDRRDPSTLDRRRTLRGGRRSAGL